MTTTDDRGERPPVRWWALASSVGAPVLLIGGWTLAAARQPGGFDSVAGTISALAALDATDRAIMTVGIAGTGVCHLLTAAGLPGARRGSRLVLAAGGVATIGVAAFPLPAGGGSSAAHGAFAVASFTALSLWPLGNLRNSSMARVPWALRPRASVSAAGVLSTATLVFFGAAVTGSASIGLLERIPAAAQSMWPLVVAWTGAAAYRHGRSGL